MSKLQRPRDRVDSNADDGPSDDKSSWSGESMCDAKEAQEWQQAPDEMPRPERFDDDEQMKKLADQYERKGDHSKAEEIRRWMASQGRYP